MLYNPHMIKLTRRGREILEIAHHRGGVVTNQQAGHSELQELMREGFLNVVAPTGAYRLTSSGSQAIQEQTGQT